MPIVMKKYVLILTCMFMLFVFGVSAVFASAALPPGNSPTDIPGFESLKEGSDFTNPARVSVEVGDELLYITIIAGNGRIINVIKEVKIGTP